MSVVRKTTHTITYTCNCCKETMVKEYAVTDDEPKPANWLFVETVEYAMYGNSWTNRYHFCPECRKPVGLVLYSKKAVK